MANRLRMTLTIVGLAVVGLTTPSNAATSGKPTAGDVFKNVTTPTLKDLSPDDFILAMALVADNLWLDGRWTAKIANIKTNVAIDASKFGNPSGAK